MTPTTEQLLDGGKKSTASKLRADKSQPTLLTVKYQQDEILTFRIATIDDIPALVALIESGYRGEESRKGWTTEADFLDGRRTDEEALFEILSEENSLFLLALEAEELVGCCNLVNNVSEAHFGMFAVRPTSQGKGLGAAIMNEVERFVLSTWDNHRLVLDVLGLRAELIAWYERRGFRPTGTTRPFPYQNSRFGIPKRDDLMFLEMAKTL